MSAAGGSRSQGALVLGVILVAVGALSINSGSWLSLISMGVGFLCLWSIFWKGQLSRVKKAYQREVSTGMPLRLDRLATHLEMEPEEVKTCLETLSAKGEIPPLRFTASDASQLTGRDNAQPRGVNAEAANRAEQRPCDEGRASPSRQSANATVAQVSSPKPSIITVRCRSCGALAQLRQGEIVECEHCGNKLVL